MILRTIKISIFLITLCLSASAQRVARSQFAPYVLRKDAETQTHSDTLSHIAFEPVAVASSFGEITREQVIDVPQSWVDASAFIHLEDVGSGYTLSINGREVIWGEDSFTPTDYNISPYLWIGENLISITTRGSKLGELEQGVAKASRTPLEGSYIFAQNRLRIFDYAVNIVEHEDKLGGELHIEVIVENGFNYPETIEIGFDVYDPAGKLVDFSTAKATLEGNSRDTIHFASHLYGAAKNGWDPTLQSSTWVGGRKVARYQDQPLYSVMLFTKRNRVSSDYIPFKVGYMITDFKDGEMTLNNKSVSLKSTRYNTSGGETESEKELRELKSKGFNTLRPDYPQPLWFYSLCDKLGLYVIDQAAINAPAEAQNKRVGGTPSNNPKYLDEYLARVESMYYRTRNFSCVIAYSLGGDSGNGYNMYKAYQWLKGVESVRPIIYDGAAGEWNSDILKVE